MRRFVLSQVHYLTNLCMYNFYNQSIEFSETTSVLGVLSANSDIIMRIWRLLFASNT